MKLPPTPFHSLFASMTTDNLREGQSNKFHSRTRAITVAPAITYSAAVAANSVTLNQFTGLLLDTV